MPSLDGVGVDVESSGQQSRFLTERLLDLSPPRLLSAVSPAQSPSNSEPSICCEPSLRGPQLTASMSHSGRLRKSAERAAYCSTQTQMGSCEKREPGTSKVSMSCCSHLPISKNILDDLLRPNRCFLLICGLTRALVGPSAPSYRSRPPTSYPPHFFSLSAMTKAAAPASISS